MLIGLPKEIKDNENRAGMTPGAVQALIKRGHQVLVQSGAGEGSSLSDEEYRSAGAKIVPYEEDAWAAQMVVKVKEPVASEYQFLRQELILFTYLHLASNKPLTDALLASGTTGIAYETVQTRTGQLPLLTPMSEVAGRMATQVGATYLQKTHGGRGVLIGGVPGVAPANVAILGGGIVGTNAARVAVGLGAHVTVLDVSHARLKYLDDIYRGQLQTRISDEYNIEDVIYEADLVIGAVLIPGGRAPWLITRNMLPNMYKGSVIVDVAVDQGGCVETTRATTHSNPTYEIDGVVHYCVANMPGAVPRTSTFALNNQTAVYTLRLANEGLDAVRKDPALQYGLNTYHGLVTYPAVAEAFGLEYTDPMQALRS
ncbi:Alanine dehydrogenase [Candidatus Methylobacter favarea]|uniref:Alanine dehydrogenase n=1 Tax=Candidatus Methylobacter favarea TaxID=2707345 RepID=A0A8S0Y5I9_9GAMM|nr:alanine dehydrogenase [Candidatus Methylobacter favarea]CAA9888516.1 Alanine dehydrogenase [Candidatus Methylobacter favarea]